MAARRRIDYVAEPVNLYSPVSRRRGPRTQNEESPIAGRRTAQSNRYHFRSTWTFDCPCDHVFRALQDLLNYPAWWPEVKSVVLVDESAAVVVIRAFLPYRLRFKLEQQVADEEAGVLQAAMTGDLEGWSRWLLLPRQSGCLLKFEEEVVVNRPLLKVLSPVARPLLEANHSVMMRRGEGGLRQYLSRNSEPFPEVKVDEGQAG